MTPAQLLPMWTVESLDHKQSFTVRARSIGEALRIAREHEFTAPATVRKVKDAKETRP